jgi:hypothetical protein
MLAVSENAVAVIRDLTSQDVGIDDAGAVAFAVSDQPG